MARGWGSGGRGCLAPKGEEGKEGKEGKRRKRGRMEKRGKRGHQRRGRGGGGEGGKEAPASTRSWGRPRRRRRPAQFPAAHAQPAALGTAMLAVPEHSCSCWLCTCWEQPAAGAGNSQRHWEQRMCTASGVGSERGKRKEEGGRRGKETPLTSALGAAPPPPPSPPCEIWRRTWTASGEAKALPRFSTAGRLVAMRRRRTPKA